VQAPPAAAKTPQRKASGQKKPLEALGSSPPPSGTYNAFSWLRISIQFTLCFISDCLYFASKKQKTSGGFHEQSIDQLNDVTAVSGVNLRVHEFLCFRYIYLLCDAVLPII